MGRIALVTNIPAPYRVDLFYYMQTQIKEHEFHVIYTSENEDNRSWKIKKEKMLNTHILHAKVVKIRGAVDGRYVHIPGNIGKVLSEINPDVVIAWEYNPAALQSLFWSKVHHKKFIHLTDGLIFDGKGYYYNYFTNKTMLSPVDSMIGFAKIIQGETENCDILYRLDERLSMPECEYVDYTCVSFEKFYGPQFKFDGSNFDTEKTIIVHIDEDTQAKLLMVVKKRTDQNMNTEFWHIEIETLPYLENRVDPVITTFLHGMYYPQSEIFTHIDYTKNQYSADEYQQKYADSIDGMPIDHYTSCRDWHYKIWCIENGEFSKETWYKLMIVSLPRVYQNLLNEILN